MWNFIDKDEWAEILAEKMQKGDIEKAENGCYLWKRTKHRDGYALMMRKGRRYTLHRIVFELYSPYIGTEGILLPGQFIHHTCGNKHCLNHEHMKLTHSRR